MGESPTGLIIEKLDSFDTHCDCCGQTTRRVCGLIHSDQGALAAYFVTWTPAHLSENGASIDLVLGRWGEGTSAHDRFDVALRHFQDENGAPQVMVVDANANGDGRLANSGLGRHEVIGTPLSPQVFAIIDSIYLQDDRLFA